LFLDLCAQQNKYIAFSEMKEALAVEYSRLGRVARDSVVSAWRQQGKSSFADSASESSLEDIVVSDAYYATSLDYWILSGLYDIPIILYSGTKLKENGQSVLVTNPQDGNTAYYFVKVPGKRSGSVGNYRLVARTEAKGGARIPIEQLEQELQDMIESVIGRDTVMQYLDTMRKAVGAGGPPGAKGVTRRIRRLRLQSGDRRG
jgi:hypothetical protein